VAEEVAEDYSSNLINLKDENCKVALVLDNRNAIFSVSIIVIILKLENIAIRSENRIYTWKFNYQVSMFNN